MNDLVLAHLSDPHLAPLPAPRALELCGKRITGYLNWLRGRKDFHRRDVLDALVTDLKAQKPAHIALTGDLVNIALPDEFTQSAQWLDTLGAPDHVTLVPGNHDAYVHGALESAFTQWRPYMLGDDSAAASTKADDVAFPFVRRRGPLSLIGLSSALATLPFMATGTLGKTQLQKLAQVLAQEQARGAFRVILIHHPLRSKHWWKRLTDSDALQAVLKHHGAELILHGHDHRHSQMMFGGPNGVLIPAIGVPSASAFNDGHHDPAAYNLYHISGAPSAWRCEMISRGFASATPGPVSELGRKPLF